MTSAGITEVGPRRGFAYVGFVDPSGGGADGFALAVAHRDDDVMILDVVRERRNVSPELVTKEYASILHSYGISTVYGDNNAGSWPQQAFARHAITYRRSDKNRSELYLSCLPLITSRRVDLLDHKKMPTQFAGLVRRTSPGGATRSIIRTRIMTISATRRLGRWS